MRSVLSIPLALLLAAAIHVDWHLARPHDHGGLSGGFALHWLLALPVFAFAAWRVGRRFARPGAASLVTIGVGVLLGQILEPLGEYVLFDDALADVFAPQRVMAFLTFMAAGLVTYGVVFTAQQRRGRLTPPGEPRDSTTRN